MHVLRKLRLFWLLAALFCHGSAWALGSQPFIKDSFLNLPDDLAEASKAGRILMVLYEQEGCPYCAKLHQLHFKDKAIVAGIKKGFDVIQLDIWGGREVTGFTGEAMTEKAFARKIGVQFSPTIAFYDAKGKEIYRMAGLHTQEQFKMELDYLSSRAYQKTGFKDYAARQARKTAKAGLIDEPFFAKTDDLKALAEQTWAQDKILALLFEQENCADCQQLHDRKFMDGDTVKLLTEHYAVVRIDTAGKKTLQDLTGKKTSEAELALGLDIQQTPTIVFFDRSGKEILRYEDHLTAEHFSGGLLTFLATHQYRQHESLQDWLRARAAANRAAQ
ncbi:MAG: thioredoxin fold domain-containing protein [Betaproteobacteria bacterium]|nr:thioredoxin fold domain-containing protein [Betaproteobacteria bacterium]